MSTLEWSNETKKLVAATVGKGLSQEGLLHLQHVSLSKGLDPLSNEIYAIPKGGRVTIIVSIHGMLKLCTPQLDGVDTVWFDDSGQPQTVWIQDGSPKGCQVTVWRKGCTKPFTAAVRYSDFAAGGMWSKMGSVMIRKVALAHALRTCFADLLSGLYSQEEMDQGGFERPAIQLQQDVHVVDGVAGKPPTGQTSKTPPSQDSQAQAAVAAVAKAFDGAPVESAAESDSEQPTALDQIRNESTADAGADLLPDRTDLPGAVGALYRKAQKVGLTRQGWHTMVQIIGGDPIKPDMAMKAVKGLDDSAKVKALNAGHKPAAVQS
jgi:phage recombination protein Bet